MKYTPGPWVVPSLIHPDNTIRVEASPDRNEEFHVCSIPARTKTGLFNAKLISAAPAMVDALQYIVDSALTEGADPEYLLGLIHQRAAEALSRAGI